MQTICVWSLLMVALQSRFFLSCCVEDPSFFNNFVFSIVDEGSDPLYSSSSRGFCWRLLFWFLRLTAVAGWLWFTLHVLIGWLDQTFLPLSSLLIKNKTHVASKFSISCLNHGFSSTTDAKSPDEKRFNKQHHACDNHKSEAYWKNVTRNFSN